ncbi:hypothetical protein BSKO_09285 [Bryopsis sp. KO-2023]|nr:hypothetical protein BSKO_09285 [Bryopsis sp. KO-2023]
MRGRLCLGAESEGPPSVSPLPGKDRSAVVGLDCTKSSETKVGKVAKACRGILGKTACGVSDSTRQRAADLHVGCAIEERVSLELDRLAGSRTVPYYGGGHNAREYTRSRAVDRWSKQVQKQTAPSLEERASLEIPRAPSIERRSRVDRERVSFELERNAMAKNADLGRKSLGRTSTKTSGRRTPELSRRSLTRKSPVGEGGGDGHGSKPLANRVRSTQEGYDFGNIVAKEPIGRGAFGTVYKANLNGRTVALKVMSQATSEGRVRIAPEFDILHGISHPNIVKILGVRQHVERCLGGEETMSFDGMNSRGLESFDLLPRKGGTQDLLNRSDTWVIMEYCDQGSLWDAVERGAFSASGEPGGKPIYSKVVEVALEVAFAMQHLHEMGIIHGDLKAQNVMLQTSKLSKNHMVAKVGDFGLCRVPVSSGGNMTTFSWGTVDHMPPEMLRNGKLRFATDVFSFAILLVEMMTGHRPFRGLASPAIIVGIVEGMRPSIPKGCPKPLANLIKTCWDDDWRKRPTFDKVVDELKQVMFDLVYAGQNKKMGSEEKGEDVLLATTASSLRIEAWGPDSTCSGHMRGRE